MRIVGKGAHSFAMILRYCLFSILPLFIEIIFVLIVIAYMYDIKFFIANGLCFVIYIAISLIITECRADHFKV